MEKAANDSGPLMNLALLLKLQAKTMANLQPTIADGWPNNKQAALIVVIVIGASLSLSLFFVVLLS